MHLTAPGNQAQRLSFVHVSRYVTRTRGVQPHGGHGLCRRGARCAAC